MWLFIHDYRNPTISLQSWSSQVRWPTECFPLHLLAVVVQYHKVSLLSLQQQTPWPSCDQWVHWKENKYQSINKAAFILGKGVWQALQGGKQSLDSSLFHEKISYILIRNKSLSNREISFVSCVAASPRAARKITRKKKDKAEKGQQNSEQ